VSGDVVVEVAGEVTPELVEAFRRLIPQLSTSNPPPGESEIHELVHADASDVLVARVDGEIVGALTLIMFRLPTGIRARIEDVVVDGAARGMGIGERLSRAALDLAHGRGARTVDLTSRPSREAANRLYVRMGFALRQSNVYRYEWGEAD
jgi:ribosomal protein S18 acetylase RimI-like enzyme